TARETHSEFASAHGRDSARDRAGKSQSPASATCPYGNGNRANAGRHKSCSRGTRSPSRSRAGDEERSCSVARKNRGSAGGLQKMAPEQSAAALRRRLSTRRGQVSKEVAVRPRIRFVDGRNHKARADRLATNADS